MSPTVESKAFKRFLILSSACLSVALTGCASEPPAFSLRDLQQNERNRAREVESRPKRPLPTTLESPFLTPNNNQARPGEATNTPPATGPSLESDTNLRLPLQEIIHRTVMNSLDVKVAGYTPAIDETRVTEAEARFDPTFFDNIQYQRTDKERGLFASGNNRAITNQVGIKQLLPSGGQVQLQYSTTWNEPLPRRNANITGSGQFWENELSLQVTQPLLRDFGNDINRARITINRNNQRVSLLDFRKQLEQTISDVESAYWDLYSAEREVKINEQLLSDTIKMAKVLDARMGQDVTRVQLSQANASIETRRTTLIRAKARVRDISDQIKRFMNDPELPVSSGALILPANLPSETPIRFERKDQIDTAMENRFELGQQQLRIDSADIARKVAKNNLLPQLNLIGSLSNQGLAEDLKGSISDNVDNKNLSASIGLQLEIPIGNREARAIYQRSLLQRLQAIDQYSSLISQISLEVTRAIREVDTTWEEMSGTRQAEFASDDALKAIEQRQEGGEALTPTFVQLKLDTQERLAQSQQARVQAVANYNKAIKDLERAKGTLLRYDNVVLEEANLPPGVKVR